MLKLNLEPITPLPVQNSSPPRIRTTVENQYAGAHGREYYKNRVKTNMKAGLEVAKGAGCTLKGVCNSVAKKSDTQDRENAKVHFDKAKDLRIESHSLGKKHKELKSLNSDSPEDARSRIQKNAQAKKQRARTKVVHV